MKDWRISAPVRFLGGITFPCILDECGESWLRRSRTGARLPALVPLIPFPGVTSVFPAALELYQGLSGIRREVGQIWGCERAYARSHPQIWGSTPAIPRDPYQNW